MPDVVYYVACSLDGFIATPDGGIDWLAPFEASGEDYGYAAFYESVDAVVLGSHTYEQALTFGEWPYAGKPTWVMSSRLLEPADTSVTITGASPREILDEIAARGLRRAWVVGGGAVAGSFQAAGLITEYIVSVIPVILGAGVGLFGSLGASQPLRLVDITRYPDGLVQLRYVPA